MLHLNTQVCMLFTGIFTDSRLVIVISKYDDALRMSAELSDDIKEENVKEEACKFVQEACPNAKISPNDVLPVSGRWAFHARMLATTPPHKPGHETWKKLVKKSLDEVPNATSGQEEEPSTSLVNLEDGELSAMLDKASGIANLEARYVYCMYNYVNNTPDVFYVLTKNYVDETSLAGLTYKC